MQFLVFFVFFFKFVFQVFSFWVILFMGRGGFKSSTSELGETTALNKFKAFPRNCRNLPRSPSTWASEESKATTA